MAKKAAAGHAAGKTKRRIANSRSGSKGSGAGRTAGKQNRLSLVRSLISKWGKKIEDDVTKAGVTELIRLLSLEKELSETTDTVREIRVTWVEPTETELSISE